MNKENSKEKNSKLRKLALHDSAFRKWQKGGRKDLTDEEYEILAANKFRAPRRLDDDFASDPNAMFSGQLMVSGSALEIPSYLELAKTLREQRNFKECEETLLGILVLQSNCVPALLQLASLLQFCLNDSVRAEEVYRKAALFNPRSAEALSHIGLLEHSRGEESQAKDWYRRATLPKQQGPMPRCAYYMPRLPFGCNDAFVELGILMEDR